MARQKGLARVPRPPLPIPVIVERLERLYGRPDYAPRFEPMDELISCILTQHTTDATAFPAFHRMKERFGSWKAVENAKEKELADVIRAAGLANQKARSIRACLEQIRKKRGDYDISHLRDMDLDDALDWLQELPGVGPKTAAIVMSFAFGKEAIPVDTHVFRVSKRIGLIHSTTDADKAHQALRRLVPEGLAYRFHAALITHGRRICKARRPHCERCPLTDSCRYYLREVA